MFMSHHLDTPLARQNGQLYIDDLYVFPGKESTVFIMDVNSTVTGPDVQHGFHPEARYEFKIHFGGAEFEELTYRATFGEADPNGQQALQLHVLTGAEARDDSAIGEMVLEGRTGKEANGENAKLWAGRIGDAFYIDLSLLAKVNMAVKDGSAVDLSSWHPETAKNSFADTTVESIVLEISHQHPKLQPGAHVGIWCTTKLATDSGGWRQINRAAHPMMWPIFWPDDIKFTDPANTRHPSEDFDAVGSYIAERIAGVVAANGTIEESEAYGKAVAQKLFPDLLPYVIGTPATYSFAEFNGRTQADNAPEVMLSLVAGTAVQSGLKPSVSKHLRNDHFPYIVPR
jgi:hypothetical protein